MKNVCSKNFYMATGRMRHLLLRKVMNNLSAFETVKLTNRTSSCYLDGQEMLENEKEEWLQIAGKSEPDVGPLK
ncbi:hypothetical protein T03_8649 [Trichinella britovi]|uniref:Uncharacterized protein n=1 Tax=Trichinella britovi TaxID=45882 RepID=A0A0V1CHA9_TRIBR|nr:hypothetical protein T03_8649 [Trichinella britovi]